MIVLVSNGKADSLTKILRCSCFWFNSFIFQCVLQFSQPLKRLGVFFLVGGGHYFVDVVVSFVYLWSIPR